MISVRGSFLYFWSMVTGVLGCLQTTLNVPLWSFLFTLHVCQHVHSHRPGVFKVLPLLFFISTVGNWRKVSMVNVEWELSASVSSRCRLQFCVSKSKIVGARCSCPPSSHLCPTDKCFSYSWPLFMSEEGNFFQTEIRKVISASRGLLHAFIGCCSLSTCLLSSWDCYGTVVGPQGTGRVWLCSLEHVSSKHTLHSSFVE